MHTHSSIDSWLGGLAAPHVAADRSFAAVTSPSPSPAAAALVYRLADRVITSGEAAARVVAAAGVPAARIVPIAPGVDTGAFIRASPAPACATELGLGDAPLVGLVANIRGSKGHDLFLEAARVGARRPSRRRAS